MDRTPGSDDMIAERENARRDEAIERWHAGHDPRYPGEGCPLCEEEAEERRAEELADAADEADAMSMNEHDERL